MQLVKGDDRIPSNFLKYLNFSMNTATNEENDNHFVVFGISNLCLMTIFFKSVV